MPSAFGPLLHENGAATVASISALSSAVLSLIPARPLRWLLVVAAPLAIALMLYWAPVWQGASGSEYSAWVLALVVPWYLAGVAASVLVCLGVERARACKAR